MSDLNDSNDKNIEESLPESSSQSEANAEAERAFPRYVLRTKTGSESRAVQELQEEIYNHSLESRFGQILAPSEEVVEVRAGQKRKVNKKLFPGYVLIQADMDLNLSHFIKSDSRVAGFVGSVDGQPVALKEREVQAMLRRVNPVEGERPVSNVLFEVGEVVSIIDGPFADFEGSVEQVNQDKQRLRVTVSIFGRKTPVELDFSQVNKI